MIKRLFGLAICVLIQISVLSSPALTQEKMASPKPPQTAFEKLVDDYFDFHFQFHPTEGTQAGLHQYDRKLENFSRAGIDAEISGLQQFQKRFDSISTKELTQEQTGDLEILTSSIRARLLELQTIQMWKKEPDVYISDLSGSIFVIMRRNFASAAERLQSVIARELEIPRVLQEARRNVVDPPRVYTDVALQQMPDNIKFFQNDVPAAFRDVQDPKLLADFKANNDAAVEALRKYQDFMRTELLPVSHGDFRIGPENFRKKLLYEEMVDIPLDRLLEVGYGDLRRNQKQLKEVEPRSTLTAAQKLCWSIYARTTRPLINYYRPSAIRWAACGNSSRKTKLLPSPRLSRPSSRKLRRSSAPSPLLPWIHPAPMKPRPPKPCST